MTRSARELLEEALRLAPEERAVLTALLIESLEFECLGLQVSFWGADL